MKNIWDLWYHFSDSKLMIYHKVSDFKKFQTQTSENDKNVIPLNKKLDKF